MDSGKLQLKDLFDIISRRRKIICRILVTVVFLAFIYNMLATPVYQASVSVRVNPRGASEAVGSLGAGSIYEDQQQKIATIAEVVKSKSVMEGVINQLYKDLPPEMRPSASGLQRSVFVSPVKGTTILNISAIALSPEEAEETANTVVQVFLQRMAELARAEGKNTRVFIGERMAEAKRNLDNIEREMVAYKKDKQTVTVDSQSRNLVGRQGELKKSEVDNELAINSARAKLADVNAQLSRQKPGFVADNSLIQQYKSKLAEQEGELIVARSTYTDAHPKVIALMANVAETRAKLSAESDRVMKAEAPSNNPVFVGLLQAKIQAEADLAVAMARHRAIMEAQAQGEIELKGIPDKEQGLVRLMRDYAVAEEAYTMLAKKYDQARIDEVMQPSNVQVVDLASRPTGPVRPRPAMNIIIAIFVGLFMGVTAAFAIDFMRKTIDTAQDVKRYMGLPLIGGVPSYELFKPKKKTSWWQGLMIRLGLKSREVHYG